MTTTVEYRPEIDGLRAIAVLAVVLYHFALGPAAGGFVGVDVFFVISGFLITGKIVEESQQGRFSLYSFYAQRMRRILPALVFTVFAVLAAGSVFLLPADLEALASSGVAAMLGLSNWYFFYNTDYFDQDASLSPLLHTWSLGVEEQFYLLWPAMALLIFKLARNPRRATLLALSGVALASFAIGIWVLAIDPKQAFYLPHARAWELALGALVVFAKPAPDGWLAEIIDLSGFSIVIAAIVCFDSLIPFPGAIAAIPCLGAALLIWPKSSPTTISRMLSLPLMVFTGRISYSLYLWHWPILVFFAYRIGHSPSGPVETGLLLVAMYILSIFSWKWIEQPMRRSKVARPKVVFASSAVAGAAIVATCCGIVLSKGLPFRFSSHELALINDQPKRGIISHDGISCSGRKISEACLIGDTTVEPSWAVLGDSHAETLLASLDRGFRERKKAAVVFTYPGCPFIMNVRRLDTHADCAIFVAEALEALKARKIAHVLIQDRSNAYILGKPFDNEEGGVEPGPDIPVATGEGDTPTRAEDVKKELRKTIRVLLGSKIDVFYFAAPPEVGWNVPQRALRQLRADLPLPTTAFDLYQRRNAPLITVLTEFHGDPHFVLVPSYKPFCDEKSKRCATADEQGLLYTDTDHLSLIGAEKLTELFFSLADHRIGAKRN